MSLGADTQTPILWPKAISRNQACTGLQLTCIRKGLNYIDMYICSYQSVWADKKETTVTYTKCVPEKNNKNKNKLHTYKHNCCKNL